MRRLSGLVVSTVAVFGSLAPLPGSSAGISRPKFENEREGRLSGVARGYACDKGPLAGKGFASRKALLMALRQVVSSRPVGTNPGGSPVRKLGKIKALSR
ncbi:hypothetical protein YTPLAS18_09500 [Nitrospira sp.]|nr:hypothetical protein YTPLAS18_09500 [Nitrospira sp.]